MPQTNDNGFTGSLNSVTVRTFKITLAATARCRITSVVMRLASSSATMPTVQIRDDVGTSNPGSTVLDALVSPSRSGSSAVDYTYTPRNASTVYDEGSSFWLFATGGSAAWQSSSPGKGYSGVATAAANRYSGDSGASYTNSFFLQTFRINGACQILS
ncbi:hypothetical protein DFJ74DRAFT_689338 [Hyaloraphidium curvatum]|nr:hypothetical protein DFJ74DRAFT_689338 [Hyaloraphidium curvatum]